MPAISVSRFSQAVIQQNGNYSVNLGIVSKIETSYCVAGFCVGAVALKSLENGVKYKNYFATHVHASIWLKSLLKNMPFGFALICSQV